MNRDGPRYHTIFFDVGGTLLRPEPSAGAIYAEVAARHGMELDPAKTERRMHGAFGELRVRELAEGSPPHTLTVNSAREWWREVVRGAVGPAADSAQFEAFFDEVFEQFGRPERYALFDDVEPVLKALAGAGYRLGLISNWDARLRGVLEGLGLLDRFDPVVISCEVGAEKPDAAIFAAARRLAGAAAEDPLMHVGDSRIDDLAGAFDAGFEGRLVMRESGLPLNALLHDLLD